MPCIDRCGLSWCTETVVAYELPLCYGHWHAVPQERRRAYVAPVTVDYGEAAAAQKRRDEQFLSWCEYNLRPCASR